MSACELDNFNEIPISTLIESALFVLFSDKKIMRPHVLSISSTEIEFKCDIMRQNDHTGYDDFLFTTSSVKRSKRCNGYTNDSDMTKIWRSFLYNYSFKNKEISQSYLDQQKHKMIDIYGNKKLGEKLDKYGIQHSSDFSKLYELDVKELTEMISLSFVFLGDVEITELSYSNQEIIITPIFIPNLDLAGHAFITEKGVHLDFRDKIDNSVEKEYSQLATEYWNDTYELFINTDSTERK